MADSKVSALTTIPVVDRAADLLYIVDTSAGTSNKVTPNGLLGITGAPVGDTDSATLTNKTLTTPAISSPVLSGTISGTYTLGGTPTFPSAVVTLTGSQTLTNKTLTSPTINTATIVNPTITADSIAGFSAATTGTIFGLAVTTSKISGASITNTTIQYTALDNGSSWAWTSWAPTTNLTVGNGTLVSKYSQVGKRVTFKIRFTFGSTSALSGSDLMYTLPVTATSDYAASLFYAAVGVVGMYDVSSGAIYHGVTNIFSTTQGTANSLLASGTYTNLDGIVATKPMTWATGDVLFISGIYEAA